MGKELIPGVEEQFRYYGPEEIVVDDVINARPFTSKAGDTEADQKALNELKESIKAHGQQVPIKVRLDELEIPHLIMGSRRLKAIAMLNLEGDERKVMAVVSEPESDEVAFRQAIIENLHRKNPNAMDNALVIQEIRAQHGWTGAKGTKKVADYLKVSTATVTQHDRLLELPYEYQVQIHGGLLTMQAGLDLLDVPEDQRAAVLAGASQIKQEEDEQAEADGGAGKGTGGGTRKKKAVGSKHVRKATRATVDEGEITKPKMLSKAEILAFFNDYYGANPEHFGFPDSPIQQFLGYFLDKFTKGMGSTRTLEKYWNALIANTDKGSRASMPTEQEDGKGKTQHRATTKAVGRTVPASGKGKKKKAA